MRKTHLAERLCLAVKQPPLHDKKEHSFMTAIKFLKKNIAFIVQGVENLLLFQPRIACAVQVFTTLTRLGLLLPSGIPAFCIPLPKSMGTGQVLLISLIT